MGTCTQTSAPVSRCRPRCAVAVGPTWSSQPSARPVLAGPGRLAWSRVFPLRLTGSHSFLGTCCCSLHPSRGPAFAAVAGCRGGGGRSGSTRDCPHLAGSREAPGRSVQPQTAWLCLGLCALGPTTHPLCARSPPTGGETAVPTSCGHHEGSVGHTQPWSRAGHATYSGPGVIMTTFTLVAN